MPEQERSKRPPLVGLQVLRALAAIAVIAHHAGVVLAENAGYDPIWNLRDVGSRGVELFFVLSGFIIMYAHWDDAGTAKLVRRYAINRVVRIIPPAFIVATGWFGVMLVAQKVGMDVSSAGSIDWQLWVSSALIVPMLSRPSPVVIWTLRHEVLFYAIFAVRYLSRGMFFALLIGWGLLSLALVAPSGNQFVMVALHHLNVLFAFGVATFFLWRTPAVQGLIARIGPGVLSIVLGAVFFGLSFFTREYQSYETLMPLLFGLSAMLLLLAMIPLTVGAFAERILVYLGNASYGIYLVHFPVIIVLYKLLERIGMPPFLAYFVLFFAGLTGGLLFHSLIEAPLTRALRKRFSAYTVAQKPDPTAAATLHG